MPTSASDEAIRVATTLDGTLTYLIDLPPEALPPVQSRDIAAAWDAARDAATRASWGAGRLFRFRRPDGSCTDLALSDPDARCWAGAVDRTIGMRTHYGLSLCLRLLALIDLLAGAPWAAELFVIEADGAELHPALLRAAGAAPLTAEARFDEPCFRARVDALAGRAPALPGAAS
jgi:hypothetical protein